MRIFWSFIFLILLGASAQAQPSRDAFEKGARAASNGNYRLALKHYQKSLEQFRSAENLPADFPAKIHYNIGVCFFHLNQLTNALERYSAAIKLSGGKYQKAFRARAMAQVELKNWGAARADFERALLLDQGDGESWFDLAMVFVREKDYARAAAAFQESIANKSVGSAAGHNNLGVILALEGNFNRAEKAFEKALLESKVEFVEAKNNLKFCRDRLQNRKQKSLAKLAFSSQNQNKN